MEAGGFLLPRKQMNQPKPLTGKIKIGRFFGLPRPKGARKVIIQCEQGFAEKVTWLAWAGGTTRSDVVNEAIALYEKALREKWKGNEITFVPSQSTKHNDR